MPPTGFARKFARVLQEPGLPIRQAWKRLPGSFELRSDLDLYPRPHYAYGVRQAAVLAKRLGIPAVTVIEFGVAGGQGLLELERMAALASAYTGVSIDVCGFDLGKGLPRPVDYRDLPFRYQGGFYEMDADALRAKLTSAQLILGDVGETVAEFRPAAPVGFVAIDVDYYSSTMAAFQLFEQDSDALLPRIWCYLDDVVGEDQTPHCQWVGELAAVADFNEKHENRKIAPIHGLAYKRIRPARWCDEMFAFHYLDHPRYNDYVGPPAELERVDNSL